MARMIALVFALDVLNQLAILSFSTLSMTLPSSTSRTGLPLRYATMSGRYASASMSWPPVCMVNDFVAPCRVPVGRFTFPLATAFATSSMPIPREARARGSSWARTAYFWEPKTCTWATPLIMEMRWAIVVSAYSSTAASGSVGELSAR